MPGPSRQLRIAELLCARIAHDLGGLIGTLSGALDLVEDAAVGAEAFAVAQRAAAELHQRLEFMRASWGPTGTMLNLAAVRALAEGLPDAGRHRLDLSGLPPQTEFAPGFARVLLNLLLLASESLHGSGEIVVSGTGNDVVVAIAGPRAAWPSGLARCLAGNATRRAVLRDARSVQMPLTVTLARALGLRLSFLLPGTPAGGVPPLRLSAA